MNNPSLPEDDLPPSELKLVDRILQQQLEKSIGNHFYQTCDRTIQALLSKCQWYVTTNASTAIVTIECPHASLNWQVLKNLTKLASYLENFPRAKIRVCPPPGTGTPFEMRVDEISVYRDSL
ncbi:MAG: hypothetical protein ACM37W_03255 [Actinomycetota bacterium]